MKLCTLQLHDGFCPECGPRPIPTTQPDAPIALVRPDPTLVAIQALERRVQLLERLIRHSLLNHETLPTHQGS